MRLSCLVIIACFAVAGCTEGGSSKLDGKIKRDTGKKDKGPVVPDIEQPDLAAVDQSVADRPVTKADRKVVDMRIIDGKVVLDQKPVGVDKLVDKGPTIDVSKVDVSKIDTGPVVGKLVINEIDYDQVSPPSDSKEFVEIYNGTSAAVPLADLAVVFVNGNNMTEYKRVLLAPPTDAGASTATLPAGGYLVIASSTVTVDPGAKVILFTQPSDQIQNGNPDGVALINIATNTVLDAFCYGGPMTSVTITGFTSAVSLVEGTALTATVIDSNTETASLARLPNGIDTNNANSDWKYTLTPTPGKANQ